MNIRVLIQDIAPTSAIITFADEQFHRAFISVCSDVFGNVNRVYLIVLPGKTEKHVHNVFSISSVRVPRALPIHLYTYAPTVLLHHLYRLGLIVVIRTGVRVLAGLWAEAAAGGHCSRACRRRRRSCRGQGESCTVAFLVVTFQTEHLEPDILES